MIKTAVYHEPNVLHIAFWGDVCPVHLRELERQLPSVMRCLRPDFSLLLDLGGISEIEYACVNPITALMERIVDAGIGKVITVVPKCTRENGFVINMAFHMPASVPVYSYGNHEEAEKNLGIDRLVSLGKVKAEYLCYQSMQSTALVI